MRGEWGRWQSSIGRESGARLLRPPAGMSWPRTVGVEILAAVHVSSADHVQENLMKAGTTVVVIVAR